MSWRGGLAGSVFLKLFFCNPLKCPKNHIVRGEKVGDKKYNERLNWPSWTMTTGGGSSPTPPPPRLPPSPLPTPPPPQPEIVLRLN